MVLADRAAANIRAVAGRVCCSRNKSKHSTHTPARLQLLLVVFPPGIQVVDLKGEAILLTAMVKAKKARRSRMRHQLGYHQGMESIQPSNGRGSTPSSHHHQAQQPQGGLWRLGGGPSADPGPGRPPTPVAGAAGPRSKCRGLLPPMGGGRGSRGHRARSRAAGPHAGGAGASGG